MALLNYSSSYSNISSFLNATSGTANWLKIFVSPDAAGGGHFITHGIDFGATYSNGSRGLVPGNGGTLNKTFLRGDGWSALWTSAAETAAAGEGTAAQQQAAKEAYLQSTLVSAYDIKQWISDSFAANNAMRFKGIITIDGEGNISNTTDAGTVSGFPTTCEVGDTYKINGNTVGNSSQIAGEVVSTGDMVVCIKAGTGSINDGQYWTIVQDNVEHLITYALNGTAFKLYAQTGNDITLFAPTTAGTSGQVLISGGAGNAPAWANAATLVVAEAAKVTYALVKGTGLLMTNQSSPETSYDGSKTITIALAKATTSALGGVIIDNGTNSEAYSAASNTSNTPYPTITVDSDGQIYLSKQNIINALGFTPGNANGQVTGVVVTGASNGYENTTSATANPYINILDGGNTVLGGYRISGSGNITVSSVANSAAIVVGLEEADSTNYGGIKIGYTAPSGSPKNYALQLDSNGKAYVNVPWVSDVFTASADGLAPMASTANKTHDDGGTTVDNIAGATTYILGSDAKWYKLPASAFQSDRRVVKLGGTEIISASSGNALNIIAGNHVNITAAQTSGNYTGAVTFDAVWRDIQVHAINNSTVSQDVESIGSNDPLVFDNSESVFMLGEEVVVGSGANATTKTVIKSYITWYNMDTQAYEIV